MVVAAEVGEPAIHATRRALGSTLVAATAFTAFAVITTQDKAVRAGSPWQNDPYDGVVSFTGLPVPALVILIALRAALLRRSGPQPVFRIDQLLRASLVCALLIAVTVVTDAVAAAVRADRPLWTVVTAGLIWSLVPLAALTVAALVVLHRARRLLPTEQAAGDWIDDLAVLADAVTTAVLRIAVARTSPARTRWRRAVWAALLTGSAATPVAAVTRDGITSAGKLNPANAERAGAQERDRARVWGANDSAEPVTWRLSPIFGRPASSSERVQETCVLS